MGNSRKLWPAVSLLALVGCGASSFSSSSGQKKDSSPAEATTSPATEELSTTTKEEPAASPSQATTDVPKSGEPISCSMRFDVPGKSNPWLAGSATSIAYPAATCTDSPDASGAVAISFANAACMTAGAKLSFDVAGFINHSVDDSQKSTADGRPDAVTAHKLGFHLGKSNIKAPINSLIAVFLGDEDPSLSEADPGTLEFDTEERRNFGELSPLLRQVFFIGDGKDDAGAYQHFTVPAGATRLFLGVMDGYEWCNNSGSVNAQVYWQPGAG